MTSKETISICPKCSWAIPNIQYDGAAELDEEVVCVICGDITDCYRAYLVICR